MEKKKKLYMTPELTVVTFKAERGYLASGAQRDGFLGLSLEYSSEGSEQLESRNESGYWGGGNGDTWF